MPTPCTNCGDPNCQGLIDDSGEYVGYSEGRMKCITNEVVRAEHRKNALVEVLFDAIEDDDLKKVQDTVAKGAPIAIQDPDGRFGTTALHKAAYHGQVAISRFLVKHCGADVNCPDRMGWTPLHKAAIMGQVDVARYLVEEEGADMWITEAKGMTALQIAQQYSKKAMVDYLALQIVNAPVSGEWVQADSLAKGFITTGESLVGCRIQALCKTGKGMFAKKEMVSGSVLKYDVFNKEHLIRFDNGVEKWEKTDFTKPKKYVLLERINDGIDTDLQVAEAVKLDQLNLEEKSSAKAVAEEKAAKVEE